MVIFGYGDLIPLIWKYVLFHMLLQWTKSPHNDNWLLVGIWGHKEMCKIFCRTYVNFHGKISNRRFAAMECHLTQFRAYATYWNISFSIYVCDKPRGLIATSTDKCITIYHLPGYLKVFNLYQGNGRFSTRLQIYIKLLLYFNNTFFPFLIFITCIILHYKFNPLNIVFIRTFFR